MMHKENARKTKIYYINARKTKIILDCSKIKRTTSSFN